MSGTLSISKFFTKLKVKQILQNVFFQALYLINTSKETREQVLTAVVAQWWLTWKMKITFHSSNRNSLLQRSSQKFRTPPAESSWQWAPAKLTWLGEDPPALFGCTADTVVSSTSREKCYSCDHIASNRTHCIYLEMILNNKCHLDTNQSMMWKTMHASL